MTKLIYKHMDAYEVIITFNIVVTSVAKTINSICLFQILCWLWSLQMKQNHAILKI